MKQRTKEDLKCWAAGATLAIVFLLCMASPAWAEPLNDDNYNGCPPIWGSYALSVPNQGACELEIAAPYSDPDLPGPINELVRSGTVTCDGGDRMPVTLHYETAPGYCRVNADIRVRTLVLVDDDEVQWQAVNGSWAGMVSAGDAADEACQSTDHWYSNMVPSSIYAVYTSGQPDGGSLFRCRVDGFHTGMGMNWSTESSDFRINPISGGPIEMRADATYRVSFEVMPDGVLEDPEAGITTRSPEGESWSRGEVVTAVPQ